MNRTAAANTSSMNVNDLSRIVSSKAEGIAWCTAFIFAFVFIVVGNLLIIVLFAENRRLRKRGLFLVINMAFADLMLGTVSLPIYIYIVGESFQLWKGGSPMSLSIFYAIVDIIFSQASLISAAFISSERFYAIYWPFKHRTLSMRAYRIIIVTVWALTFVIATLWSTLFFLNSNKRAVYVWMPYVLILTFIICGCNIGTWRKFGHAGNIASQQQNRDSQNKRLTKTLLFVSILALLTWLPLIIFNCLIVVYDVKIPGKFNRLVNIINYSNSFVNPVVYALRIPEFRQALVLFCLKRTAVPNIVNIRRRDDEILASTPTAETLPTETNHIQLTFEQEPMETKV